jgi:hypothetical protein
MCNAPSNLSWAVLQYLLRAQQQIKVAACCLNTRRLQHIQELMTGCYLLRQDKQFNLALENANLPQTGGIRHVHNTRLTERGNILQQKEQI